MVAVAIATDFMVGIVVSEVAQVTVQCLVQQLVGALITSVDKYLILQAYKTPEVLYVM